MVIRLPNSLINEGNKIRIDLNNHDSNIFQLDNIDYIPYYLNNNRPGNRGGNSYVLKLVEAQEFDEDDGYPEIPDLIIKISKAWKSTIEIANSLRFKREIESLIECNEQNCSNVVAVKHSGLISIFHSRGFRNEHRFYTMDYAQNDLRSFLSQNNLSLVDRVELCFEICQSLNQIWNNGYYHRDIKPDNILFIDGYWVISDLGLIEHRDEDIRLDLDEIGGWVGPRGWMSPESMNKFLCEGYPWERLHDCSIDHQSDIYQLGKVFWYILQGNSPEGGIRRKDFIWKNENLYQIVRTMINNSKGSRYTDISNVIQDLKRVFKQLEKKSLQEVLY